jgi:hypothetical protein
MRRLTKREARRVDEEDNTPYVVVHAGSLSPLRAECRYRVTGYTSARVVAKGATRSVILTAAEAAKLSRTPYFS